MPDDGGSIASGSSSRASSAKEQVAVSLFTESIPVFPLLQHLIPSFQSSTVYAGMLIQLLQLFGFVLNPRLTHGEGLGALSPIIYTSHLPFWDPRYSNLDFSSYAAMFWIAVAVILTPIVAIGGILVSGMSLSKTGLGGPLLSRVVHGVTTVLFIPLLQSCMAVSFCHSSTNRLVMFPDEPCNSQLASASLIVGIIAAILLVLQTLLFCTTLFSIDYKSLHPFARGDALVDGCVVIWKALTVVLFHVAILQGKLPWLCLWVFFSCALIYPAAVAYLLPHYRQDMNQTVVAASFNVALAAVLTYLCNAESVDPVFYDMDMDTLLMVSCGGPLYLFAAYVVHIRVNPRLMRQIRRIIDGSYVGKDAAARGVSFRRGTDIAGIADQSPIGGAGAAGTAVGGPPGSPLDTRAAFDVGDCRFPHGLPIQDLSITLNADLLRDIEDGTSEDEIVNLATGAIDGQLPTPEISEAFLTRVYSKFDVPLACRFLGSYFRITDRFPTPRMVAFAARIFMKGLCLHWEDSGILLPFAHSLFIYANRPRLGLALLDRVNRTEATFSERFHAYHLSLAMKQELNMRDNNYQRICDRARKYHKEALTHVAAFWNKLLAVNVDAYQLGNLIHLISTTRESCETEFRRALTLNCSERSILTKYSQFVDQIMLDGNAAERLRDILKNDNDERRRSSGRSRNKEMEKEVQEALLIQDEDKEASAHTGSLGRAAPGLSLLALLITLSAFLGYSIVQGENMANLLKSTEAAGQARALSAEGTLIAFQYLTNVYAEPTAQQQQKDALFQRSTDLTALHHALTFGSMKPQTPTAQLFYTGPSVVAFDTSFVLPNLSLSLPLRRQSFGSYAFDVAGRFQLAATQSNNTALNSTSLLDFMKNYLSWTTFAFNRSVHVQVLQTEESIGSQRTVNIIIFVLCILSMFALVGILNLRAMETRRIQVAVMRLFMILPRPPVAVQAAEAKDRVKAYDEAEDDFGGRSTQLSASMFVNPVSGEAVEAGAAFVEDEDAQQLDGNPLTEQDRSGTVSELERELATAKQFTLWTLLQISVLAVFVLGAFGLSVVQVIDQPMNKQQVEALDSAVSLLTDQQREIQDAIINMQSVIQLGPSGVEGGTTSFSVPLQELVANTNEVALSMEHFHRYDWMTLHDVSGAVVRQFDDSIQQSSEIVIGNVTLGAKLNEPLYLANIDSRSELLSSVGYYRDNYPLTDPLERARVIMQSQSVRSLTRQVSAALGTEVDLFRSNADSLVQTNFLVAPPVAAGLVLAFSSVALIAYISLGSEVKQRPKLLFGKAGKLTIVSVLLLLALVIAVSAAQLHVGSRRITAVEASLDARREINKTEVTLNFLSETARAFTQTGDLNLYNEYFAARATFEEDIGFPAGSFPLATPTPTADVSDSAYAHSTLMNRRTIQELLAQQEIAIRLTGAAFGIPNDAMLEVRSLSWNATDEWRWNEVRILYPQRILDYTTSAFDLTQLPPLAQTLVARHTVFGPRYQRLMNDVKSLATAAAEDRYHEAISERDRLNNLYFALSIVLIATTSLVLLVICIQVGGSAFAIINRSFEEANSSQTSNNTHLLFQLSLGVIVALTIGALVVMFQRGADTQRFSETLEAATAQEWQVTLIGFNAETKFAQLGRPSRVFPRVSALRTEMANARRIFHFGPDGSHFLSGVDPEQDALMYTDSSALPSDFSCGVETPDSVGTKAVLAGGLANAVENFLQDVDDYLLTSNVTKLRQTALPLSKALRASSYLYLSYSLRTLNSYNITIIALLTVAIVLVLLQAWLLVWPLVAEYERDEADALLLIKMIPQQVKDGVPAVSEFIRHELEIGAQNNAASGDSSSIAEMSTSPVISIDIRGYVLKFNEAAEQLFGYTAAEVVGNKVNMLMPPAMAAVHDQILSNYLKTRIRRAIGYDRRVHGQHKNGHSIPIELSISEMVCETGETVYIAFIKDVTRLLELQKAEKLNTTIQELATVPMIAIDTLGTVIRFNKAAEQCFGHNSADVLGSNVKMLMPESTAKYHDSYLANYLRTGVRRVIDQVRRLTAVRKTGEEFPLELAVKQISTSDFGTSSTYLAFARDITDELILDEANRVNDCVADLSPVPIVGIDALGKVLKFSLAASQLFQYEPSEVLGKNIKMLMPAEIAEQHDGYLENYRKTGVKKVIGKDRELVGKRKDGTTVAVLALVREVKQEGASLSTFVGYLQDRTAISQSKKKKALQDGEFDANPAMLFLADPIGTILRCNNAACVELGYRKAELVGHNLKKIMPEEIAVHHDAYLQRYLKTKDAKVIGKIRRVTAKRKDGRTFAVEIRVDEVINENGQNTYVGMLRNLKEQLELESNFAINETMISLSPSPVICIDPNGFVSSFNKAAEKLWGYEASMVEGRNVKMLMPEEHAQKHDGYLARYRDTKVKRVVDTTREIPIRLKDGTEVRVDLKVKEVKVKLRRGAESSMSRDSAGSMLSSSAADRSGDSSEGGAGSSVQLNLFIGFITDHREVVLAKVIADRIAQISALSPTPLLKLDIYGTIVTFNAAASREFGWAAEDVIGRNVKILMPDSIAKVHDGYLAAYRKTRVKHVIGTLRLAEAKRRDGTTFPVELGVQEIEGETENEHSYIGYCRNVAHEMKLKLATEMNSVVASLSPLPIIAIGVTGLIVQFNTAASKAFGYAAEEVVGKNVKMLMPPEVAKKHDGYLTAYQKTGEKHVINSTRKLTAIRKDGSPFRVELNIRELLDEGKISSYLGSVRPCDDEDQSTHEEEIRTVMETQASEGIFQATSRGILTKVNDAFAVAFGSTYSELLGSPITSLLPLGSLSPITTDPNRRHSKVQGSMADLSADVLDATHNPTSESALLLEGTRFVVGCTKNKEWIPIELSVRHLNTDGVTTVFGTIRRLEIQRELKQMEALSQKTVETDPVALVSIDEDGIIVAFNEAASELWGYSPSEAIRQNVKILMNDLNSKQHDDYLRRYMTTGVKKVIGGENVVKAKRKSGDIFTAVLYVHEISVPNPPPGAKRRFVAAVQDLADQKLGAIVATQAAVLKTMLPLSIIVLTSEGEIFSCNETTSKTFGYSEPELLGKHVKLILPPDGDIVPQFYLHKVKREQFGRNKSGAVLSLEVQVEKFDHDGEDRFMLILFDRTEEKKLREDYRRSRGIIDQSVSSIIAIDQKGTVCRFSQAAEQQFGYKAEEVLGQNIKMLLEPSIAAKHDEYLRRYNRTGEKHVIDTRTESEARHKSGRIFPVEIFIKELTQVTPPGASSSASSSQGLEAKLFIGFVKDITAEVAARQARAYCSALEDAATVPFIAYTANGRIISCSFSARTIFGFGVQLGTRALASEAMTRSSKHRAKKTGADHSGSSSRSTGPAGGSSRGGTSGGGSSVTDDILGMRVERLLGVKPEPDTETTLTVKVLDDSEEFVTVKVRTRQVFVGSSTMTLAFIKNMHDDFEVFVDETLPLAILAESPDAIISIDEKGIIQTFNRAASLMFDFTPEQAVGRNVKILMTDKVASKHDSYLERYAKTKNKTIMDKATGVQCERKNGEVFSAELMVRELTHPVTQKVTYWGTIRDLSQRASRKQ